MNKGLAVGDPPAPELYKLWRTFCLTSESRQGKSLPRMSQLPPQEVIAGKAFQQLIEDAIYFLGRDLLRFPLVLC